MTIAILIVQIAVLLVALRALHEYLLRSGRMSQHMSSLEGRITRVEKREIDMVEAVISHVQAIERVHLGLPEHKILKP